MHIVRSHCNALADAHLMRHWVVLMACKENALSASYTSTLAKQLDPHVLPVSASCSRKLSPTAFL